MTEIIFEVQEDVIDGGFVAHALGAGIHTEGDTQEELKTNIRDALECHFDAGEIPRIVRLHFVRDEVMAV
ncbi:MAG: 2-oxoisovalerate dehydrogenase [Kiritimatiellae bacterium]|jgi:predicted RNase H-like HicB family nuclease|nr:2-oxoisovalerate dehydrogenase [Kiritimatiellia bacterium]